MTAVVIYKRGASSLPRSQWERLKLGQVSRKHALTMLWRGVAQAVEYTGGQPKLHSIRAVELVVQLVTVASAKTTQNLPYSKRGVLARDKYICAFCGGYGDTIDHVTPRAQGGKSSWLNCVAACYDCNQEKADRTPEQAGMPLVYGKPFTPTLDDLGWDIKSYQSVVVAG